MNVLTVTSACPSGLEEEVRGARAFSDVFNTSRPLSYHSHCFVTLANVKSSGQQVVVKSYIRSKLSPVAMQQVLTEIDIHNSLVHNHVVSLMMAFEDGRHTYLIIEYANGGDLRKHFPVRNEKRVREFIVQPLLQALVLLQQEGVVHRDLKPDNVLVHNNEVKLADFGLGVYHAPSRHCSEHGEAADEASLCSSSDDGSCSLSSDSGDECKTCHRKVKSPSPPCLIANAGGTPLYAAPEVLQAMFKGRSAHEAVSHKNDIWALGVMALEAVSGCHPFNPDHYAQDGNVLYSIANHQKINFPSFLSQEFSEFLDQALQRDPKLRPTAADLFRHPWMTKSFGSTGGAPPSATAGAGAAGAGSNPPSSPSRCGMTDMTSHVQEHSSARHGGLSFLEEIESWEY